MYVDYEMKEKALSIGFEEEIDHHTCLKSAIIIDDAIKKFMPKKVIFDFENVSFMDSSGIGMLIGRYRKIIRNNGIAEITNLRPELRRIFEMSGILKIMCEKWKERKRLWTMKWN